MTKYRFKTKEEFIKDDEWHFKNDAPRGWNYERRMNGFLGEDIPDTYNSECDKKKQLSIGIWNFRSSNYVLKETTHVNTTVPKPSNSIPEYVEGVSYFRKEFNGKIYNTKLDKPEAVTKCSWEQILIESGRLLDGSFKPSTKEAYDAQNTALIDKWAIKCTQENKEHLEKFFHSKDSQYQGYAPSWNIYTGHYYHYPQQEEGLWGYMEIQKGYREITTEEFCKIAGVVTEVHDAPTFEVGKWYKYKNWYIKYKKHDKGFWTSSEEIDDDDNYRKTISTFGGFKSDHEKILLTDLSEIQPYLPDGHPDKIVEQKMFKKGDYIVYLSTGTSLLLQNYCYKQSQDENYLRVKKDACGFKNCWPALGRYEESHNWRYATPEEIKEYDRLSAPYDVTTISNKVSFKKGDYIVITECNAKSYNGKLNHCYKLIGDNFNIGDYDRIPLDEPNNKKARLATPEEITEYNRLGAPYDVTTLFQKKTQQESFPKYLRTTRGVVCKIVDSDYSQEHYLVENSQHYLVENSQGEKILVDKKSVSEAQEHEFYSEKQSSMPLYVKCINGYGSACVGKIYRTDDDKQAKNLFLLTWEQVLIKYNHLGTKFIPVTYPEYSEYHSEKVEQSKPSPDGYPIKKETLIEDVHSVSVMLSTKNKSKQFKF